MNTIFKIAVILIATAFPISSCSKNEPMLKPVDLTSGTVQEPDSAPETAPIAAGRDATLLLGGSDKVTIVRTKGMENGCDYTPYVVSQWNAATAASLVGYAKNKMEHIDDCKPVNGGELIAVTSSYNWIVVLNRDLAPVFWAKGTTNAHSADVIRNKYVVVACSTGGDELRLYDILQSNTVKYTTPLESAHGVVWNEATERLYAIGGKKLQVYRLDGYGGYSPELTLEKTYATPQNGLHDLTLVNDSTLCLGGKECALFDIPSGKFTVLPLFRNRTALKSLNYNSDKDEMWYTDATVPEGDYTWSTHTVHHTSDPYGNSDDFIFRVSDQNLYKVRPLNW